MEARLTIIKENQVSATNLLSHLKKAVGKKNGTLKNCVQSRDSLHEKVENLDSKQRGKTAENSNKNATKQTF